MKTYEYIDQIKNQLRLLYQDKTTTEVAELSGLHKNTVQTMLGPRTENFTFETLHCMVTGAGVNMTELFEAIEYPDPDEEPAPLRKKKKSLDPGRLAY